MRLTKKIIGSCLIALPFLGSFAMTVIQTSLLEAFLIFIASAVTIAIVGFGLKLVTEN